MYGIGADDTIMHIGGCGDSLGTSETACGVIEHFARCEEPDAASSTARSGSATPSTTRSTSIMIAGTGADSGSAFAATTERVELAYRLLDGATVREDLIIPPGGQPNSTMFNRSLRLAWDGFADPAHTSSRSVNRIQPSQDVSPAPSAYICPCPLTNPLIQVRHLCLRVLPLRAGQWRPAHFLCSDFRSRIFLFPFPRN